MMIKKMKGIGIEGYQEQMEMAKELGVKIYACNTSMSMMGIKKEDLIDGVTVLGGRGLPGLSALTRTCSSS
jgi:predicted peroxiredoxin